LHDLIEELDDRIVLDQAFAVLAEDSAPMATQIPPPMATSNSPT
jgi:hypothetical protein